MSYMICAVDVARVHWFMTGKWCSSVEIAVFKFTAYKSAIIVVYGLEMLY